MFNNKALITGRANVFIQTFTLGLNIVPPRKMLYMCDPGGNSLKTNSEIIAVKKGKDNKKAPIEHNGCERPLLHTQHEKIHSGMKKYKPDQVRKDRHQDEDLILHYTFKL